MTPSASNYWRAIFRRVREKLLKSAIPTDCADILFVVCKPASDCTDSLAKAILRSRQLIAAHSGDGKSQGGERAASATLDEIWREYLKDRAIPLRNRLVEHYRPLVHIQAARLAQKLPAQISFEEICSAGYDGLIEAVEAFDPKHKAKFKTFCQRRIHGAVMDWLRELDVQSRTVRSFEKARMQRRELMDGELGRPPTDEELSAGMNMSRGRFRELSRLARLGHEVHLSAVQAEDDGQRSGSGWDVHDESAVNPADKVSHQMFTEYMIRGLNREERLVLVLYYYEGLTMAEIGQVLNLSESRVSQIHKDVIDRLRRRFYADEVNERVA